MSLMHLPRFMHSSQRPPLYGGWPLHAMRSRTVQTTLQGQPRNPSMDPSLCTLLYVTLKDRPTSIQDPGFTT
ncbi:unnamed protein product [Lasius platythorax]|uniref:Uncharacterized protein n=1 Tax=Lasius platythorax TaxID=488582 RepID=A0AAV2N6D0_9HYME